MAFDQEQEVFVVHIATFFVESVKEHLDRKVQITAFIADKIPIIILAEYSDFVDVFFKKSAAVLSKYTKINIHEIDL